MFFLIWDVSDQNDPSYEKLVRAGFSSLEEAISQAEHDIAHGNQVVCIEELLEPPAKDHMNRGTVVWEP